MIGNKKNRLVKNEPLNIIALGLLFVLVICPGLAYASALTSVNISQTVQAEDALFTFFDVSDETGAPLAGLAAEDVAISIHSVLVDQYYNYSPSIIFTSGEKGDQLIRSWFGLTGDGRYSMSFEFGNVMHNDFGYKLVIENGELYQVPIIHEGTSMKVYYRENGESK